MTSYAACQKIPPEANTARNIRGRFAEDFFPEKPFCEKLAMGSQSKVCKKTKQIKKTEKQTNKETRTEKTQKEQQKKKTKDKTRKEKEKRKK